MTELSDFSFVNACSFEDVVEALFISRFIIDNYGMARIKPFNIADTKIKELIHNKLEIINSETNLIDGETTKNIVGSPCDASN